MSEDASLPGAPVSSITIVGFGLIGASLALALKRRDSKIVVRAVDLPNIVELPEVQPLADVLIASTDETRVREAYAASELTVLAAPVRVVQKQLPEVLRYAQLVTDCGSTKREIVDVVRQASHRRRFVGGHPMAGKTRSGFAAASADLYESCSWILCPEDCAPEALATVEAVVRFVGAQPVEMTAARHDAAVALTSHLPKLVASLLVTMCNDAGAQAARGPGFHSATRVAGGETGIWRDILATNADEVARVAERLGRELIRLASDLSRGDSSSAIAVVDAARRMRD